MKIITNDYRCGTSSAILDYNDFDKSNVVIVSEYKHKHVFDIVDEDLLFIGHDFLHYLWDSEKYVNHWKNYRGKKHIWCFEKIDSIILEWQKKSHHSLSQCYRFTNSFYASDEQDCRKYNIKWLPQWGSKLFFDNHAVTPQEDKILFSGQAGLPGYEKRDKLLLDIFKDDDLKDKFYTANIRRSKSWDEYVSNFLNHKIILAPIGNFKGFNTRTYEALTSGRVLLQQVDSEYKWHVDSLSKYRNVIFFETFEELKNKIVNLNVNDYFDLNPEKQYLENNLHSRLGLIK